MQDIFQDLWEIRRIESGSNPDVRTTQPVAERYITGATAARDYAASFSSISGIPHKAWACTQTKSGRILHRDPIQA